LPGLDGTGGLFEPILHALPAMLAPAVVSYPTKERLGYRALQRRVEAALPTDRPFAIVAESFSTPLAIRIAAQRPPGLVAIVLAGAFLANPIGPWSGPARLLARPWLFKLALPNLAIRRFLLEADASDSAVTQVAAAVGEVAPDVLASRLEATLTVDAVSAFESCDVPMLCIDAARERLLDPSVKAQMVRLRPDIPHVVIDAPHLILQARPNQSAGVIERFVLDHLPPPSRRKDVHSTP
jgi:pimeloyl-ACP methyl ester carboxylesterase